jgi:hypothetical protein
MFDPNAVQHTRNLVGEAVSQRTESAPAFPRPEDFATEDEYCEAFLDALFGKDR